MHLPLPDIDALQRQGANRRAWVALAGAREVAERHRRGIEADDGIRRDAEGHSGAAEQCEELPEHARGRPVRQLELVGPILHETLDGLLVRVRAWAWAWTVSAGRAGVCGVVAVDRAVVTCGVVRLRAATPRFLSSRSSSRASSGAVGSVTAPGPLGRAPERGVRFQSVFHSLTATSDRLRICLLFLSRSGARRLELDSRLCRARSPNSDQHLSTSTRRSAAARWCALAARVPPPRNLSSAVATHSIFARERRLPSTRPLRNSRKSLQTSAASAAAIAPRSSRFQAASRLRSAAFTADAATKLFRASSRHAATRTCLGRGSVLEPGRV